MEFSRTKALIGDAAFNKLNNSNVIVFGVGGVGGFVIEGLVRSGVGAITLVDNDDVNITNINRQIIALHSTIGKNKCDVMEERIKDINPNCNVSKYKMFYSPEENAKIDLSGYDYIIDCIDTVKAKIDLVVRANELNIPILFKSKALAGPTPFIYLISLSKSIIKFSLIEMLISSI